MTQNIVLGVTGSVAAIKTAELVRLLMANDYRVVIVLTKAARHFVDFYGEFDHGQVDNLVDAQNRPIYFTDDDEWLWSKRGDPVLHILLRQWANQLLIAPLTANSLSKIANGLCDNLLTSIVRAWPSSTASKPILVAPAMNTEMYNHPLTSKHLRVLQEDLGMIIIEPMVKTLMCGEHGIGAMASLQSIIDKITNHHIVS